LPGTGFSLPKLPVDRGVEDLWIILKWIVLVIRIALDMRIAVRILKIIARSMFIGNKIYRKKIIKF